MRRKENRDKADLHDRDTRREVCWGMIKMAQWEARYQEKWKRREEEKKQDA